MGIAGVRPKRANKRNGRHAVHAAHFLVFRTGQSKATLHSGNGIQLPGLTPPSAALMPADTFFFKKSRGIVNGVARRGAKIKVCPTKTSVIVRARDAKTPHFPAGERLNPKTEIGNGQMSQDIGAQTHWKNRSHTRSGLARFFQCVCAQEIASDGRFLFRFLG